MADTYTTNLNLTKPEPGAAEDTWGISLNDDLDTLDAIFSSSGTQINLNPNQVNFADNKKAIFGTGGDLEIYHDGSHSYIQDSGTGNLYLTTNGNKVIIGDTSGERGIEVVKDGEVLLKHNNNNKLATTSSGIDVTGTIVSDGVSVAGGSITVNNYLTAFTLPNNSQQYMDVAKSFAVNVDSDNNSTSESFNVTYDNRAKKALTVQEGGDVSFYDDTGTSQNLTWDASADSLNFVDNAKAQFGAGNDLQIYHNGSHSFIANGGNGALRINNGTGNIELRSSTIALQDNSAYDYLRTEDLGNGGIVKLYHGSVSSGTSEVFRTTSTGIDVTGTVTADGIGLAAGSTISSAGGLIVTIDDDNSSGSTYFEINADGTSKSIARFVENGDISFYDDTGSTQGLFWDASAETLAIGHTSPSSTYRLDVAGGIRSTGTAPSYTLQESDASNQTWLMASYAGTFAVRDTTVAGSSYPLQIQAATPNNTLFLKSDGSVGIGTSTPSDKLEVYNNGADVALKIHEDAGTHASRIHLRSGTTDTYIQNRDATNGFEIRTESNISTSNNAALSISNMGVANFGYNVGIGTSSPAEKLSIQDGDIIVQNDTKVTFGYRGTSASSALAFRDRFAGVDRVTIDSSGNVGIAGATTIDDGNLQIGDSDADFNIAIAGARSKFGYDSSNNSAVVQGGVTKGIIFCVNNSTFGSGEAARIDSSGRVGIGTSSPDVPLEVVSASPTNGIVADFVNSTNAGGTTAAIKLSNADSESCDVVLGANRTVANFGSDFFISLSDGADGSNQERFRITEAGNVGIGTVTPNYLLDVEGSGSLLRVNSTSGNSIVQLSVPDTTSITGVNFGDSGSTTAGYIWYRHTGDSMAFTTAGSEAMRILSSGNVGIGTSSPQKKLHIEDNGYQLHLDGGNNFWNVGAGWSGYYDGSFLIANTTGDKLVIDVNGRVGIGTNSPSAKLDVDGGVSINSGLLNLDTGYAIRWGGSASGIYSGSGNSDMVFTAGSSERFRVNGLSGNVGIGTTSPSASLNIVNAGLVNQFRVSNTVSDATTKYGAIVGSHYTNSEEPITGMLMTSSSSTTGGRVSIGGGISSANAVNEILFYTAANNTTLTGSERARIDSSGNLLVGKTSASVLSEGVEARPDGIFSVIRDDGQPMYVGRKTSDGTLIDFRKDGATVGSISTASGTTSYNTSSDARLKDVTGEARGLEVITKLNPVAYNWKADGKADEGLIAQEVKEIVPNAVSGSEDEHYQMDYSKLVTPLVKAIQEQQEQIESLKSEIAKLKGE